MKTIMDLKILDDTENKQLQTAGEYDLKYFGNSELAEKIMRKTFKYFLGQLKKEKLLG